MRIEIDQKACFVAGTLVHTKDGLRSIEEIKVGDYVLSKPENGGELAYKRVTKTFVRENAEVWGVTYEDHFYSVDRGNEHLIVTTAEHLFWAPKLLVDDPNVKFGSMMIPHNQWVKPEDIFKIDYDYHKGKGEGPRHYFSAFDGKEYGVMKATPICVATQKQKRNRVDDHSGPNFGVLWPVSPFSQREAEGSGVDFRVSPPALLTTEEHKNIRVTNDLDKKTRNTDKATWVAGTTEYYTRGYQPKLCTVYNLEVEDYDTYFVGEHGIWVHNTCIACEGEVTYPTSIGI